MMADSPDPPDGQRVQLRHDIEDRVLTITMDDGDRNALVPDTLRQLVELLDDSAAAGDADAVVLAGSGTIFTAGLDVKWMERATADDVGEMLVLLGRAVMRLWGDARPTVAACTGHAVAAGTMLALACDHAIAADGDYRWGLMETRIAYEMPMFGIELARANVGTHRVDDLVLPGAVVGPVEAVEVGFADELAPLDDVLELARMKAHQLMALPAHTYAGTKARLRAATITAVEQGLEEDIARVMATAPVTD